MPSLKALLLILVIAPIGWIIAAESPDAVGEFRTMLYEWALEGVNDEHSKELLDSGLDKSDVDEILAVLAERATECFMDALVAHAQEHSIDMETLVSDDEDKPREHNAAWAILTRDDAHQTCFMTAWENAGLPPD